jgi:hypothetical protein
MQGYTNAQVGQLKATLAVCNSLVAMHVTVPCHQVDVAGRRMQDGTTVAQCKQQTTDAVDMRQL